MSYPEARRQALIFLYLKKAQISLLAFYFKVDEEKIKKCLVKTSKEQGLSEQAVTDNLLSHFIPVFSMEIFELIMLHIKDPETVASMCQTSKVMSQFCQSQRFWRLKYQIEGGKIRQIPKNVLWKDLYYWENRRRPTLALGCSVNLFTDKKGRVYEWEKDGPKEDLHFDKRVVQVSCGPNTAGMISSDGKVYLWGNNTSGAVGNQSNVEGEPDFYLPTPGKVSWVSCSRINTGIITEFGGVYMLGSGSFGQLGNQWVTKPSHDLVPIKIPGRGGQISCGEYYVGVVTWEGKLYMWGINYKKQLGVKVKYHTNVPRRVWIDGYIIQVSCGKYHTGAVTRDGKVYLWGDNFRGQLGDGTQKPSNKPIHISIPEKVVQVSCGKNHTGVVTQDGKVYLWGENNQGQIGNGSKHRVVSPIHIPIPGKVKEVSCGWCENTGVVTQDGKLYLWGRSILKPKFYSLS